MTPNESSLLYTVSLMYLTRKKITTNNVKSKYSTSYIISPDLSWVQDKVTSATSEILKKCIIEAILWLRVGNWALSSKGRVATALKT